MAYVDPDYPTKKAFIAGIEAGEIHRPYNPSGMFPVERDGKVTIEGPHYPKPHKWYAVATVVNGVVVSAK